MGKQSHPALALTLIFAIASPTLAKFQEPIPLFLKKLLVFPAARVF